MKLRQICCDPGLCFENYKGSSAKQPHAPCLQRDQKYFCVILVESLHKLQPLLLGRGPSDGVVTDLFLLEAPADNRAVF